MSDKWNMIVDVARCENCHNCTLAVKDEHVENDFPGYAAAQPRHGHEWIKLSRKVRGRNHLVDTAYLPTMCNHCDDAPCIKASGNDGSIYKRPDGIVIIDPVRAKGRREIVDSCPYNAISWNEELSLPQAWIFDAHLLDQGWKEPRASQACPTGALEVVKVSDAEMKAKAEQSGLEVLRPDLKTHPRVYYKNLYRYTKCFIGGTVLSTDGQSVDCLEAAEVILLHNGAELGRARTDVFGDFKFDKLEPDSGEYQISISANGHTSATASAMLGESFYVGEVQLVRAANA